VLANDSDPNGDALAVSAVSDPPHGTASKNANGTVHYQTDGGYTGSDNFTYTVSDGRGGTADGTVNVTVTPPPSGTLTFPGVSASAGTTVNRLSDLFTPQLGMVIKITLTSPLNDTGNIGVYCSSNGENHYENATVGTHTWGIGATSGTCFVYSWKSSTYRSGLTGAGSFVTSLPVEPPAAYPGASLTFPGAAENRPSVSNRLSGLFQPVAGSTVTITLTAALNDSGNIGVYCVASGENHYGTASVGSRSYTIAAPGDCFIYSWRSGQYRPGLTGGGTFTYTPKS